MSDIVPFGKYKGKPLESMMQDKPYIEWLMGQGWFQKHNLYTIVVNNFGEASETPEHNAMQALFLDDKLNKNISERILLKKLEDEHPEVTIILEKEIEQLEKEIIQYAEYGWDVEEKNKLLINRKSLLKVHEEKRIKAKINTRFEINDVDVELEGTLYLGAAAKSFNFLIELKPQVGDDYPAVLRSMIRKKCNVLVLKQYTGTGVTKEQFIDIFKSSHIKVLFLDEIEKYKSE